MTHEQELIKKVIAAADKYVASESFNKDDNPSDEHKEWDAAFNELREYAKTIPDA